MLETERNKVFFLVDTQNVGNNWIKYVTDCDDTTVLLFLAPPALSLSYAELDLILKMRSKVVCYHCTPGLNALDFQLVSYLGFMLATSSVSDRFIIMSNDKGFDCTCGFWQQRGYNVERMEVKSQARTTEKTSETDTQVIQKKQHDIRCQSIKYIGDCLPQKDKGCAKEIFAMLESHEDANLQVIYQWFIKTYGQPAGLDRYRLIKPIVKKIQIALKEV